MANTAQNISQIKIKDLIRNTIIKSSLISMIDVRDLIMVNPNFSYVEVMTQLIKDALGEHERKCPMYKKSIIFVENQEYTFQDNFSAFLDGTVPEDYITLIPRLIYSFNNSVLHHRRNFRYVKPTLYVPFSSGKVIVDYMCSYPVVFKTEEPTKNVDEFTDDSIIYYLDPVNGMSKDFIFGRMFYLTLLKYINNIKNNLQYPDMPLQVLQGIDQEIQTVDNEVSDFYRRSSSHGKLYI